MCVIIAGLGTPNVPQWELEDACTYNPDGFGWGILFEDGTLEQFNSLTSTLTVDKFLETAKMPGIVAWLFHARIATHGAVTVDNCHPFNVSRETLLAHNGVLPVQMPKGYKGSDSAYFAETLLPLWGGVNALNHSETWSLLEEWMGHSKVVLLSADPAAPMPLMILNEVLGKWEGNTWYSNTYHRMGYGVNPANVSRGTTVTEYLEGCLWCDEPTMIEGICTNCYTCQECSHGAENCRCSYQWSETEGIATWR